MVLPTFNWSGSSDHCFFFFRETLLIVNDEGGSCVGHFKSDIVEMRCYICEEAICKATCTEKYVFVTCYVFAPRRVLSFMW